MPVVLKAREEIKKGGLGRLVSVSCSFSGSPGDSTIPYSNPYHWAYNLRGGILQNMIDHPLSLVLCFLESVDNFKVTSLARNALPNEVKDMIQITLNNADQIGMVFLSFGHGSNHRAAELLFENAIIKMDLGRQLYSCIRGTGRQNFLMKAYSGISEGSSYIFGTINNFYNALTGKLQSDPGITNTLKNYYNAIAHNESLIVPQTLIIQLTSILDKIWDEVDSQNVSKVNLIEERVK
jgi:predicted dehydrogenase